MNIIELLNKSAQGIATQSQQKTASAQPPARLSHLELLQVMVTHNHMEKAAALNLPPASWQRVAGTAAGAGIGAGLGYAGTGMLTDDRRLKLLGAILGGLGGGYGGYRVGSHYSPLVMTDAMKNNLGPTPATPAQEGLEMRRWPGAWNAMGHEGAQPGNAEEEDAAIDKQTASAKKPDDKEDKADKEDKVKKAAALYAEKGA